MVEICWHCGGQVLKEDKSLVCVQCGREPVRVLVAREQRRFHGLNKRLIPSLTPTPKHNYQQDQRLVRKPLQIYK